MFSTFTIIVCTALVLLALLSTLMNPFLRVPISKAFSSSSENSEEEKPSEPISVIIIVNDDIQLLERNLPLLLQQEYEPGFQIIVVADKGNAQADDMVKRYRENAHLTSTFIPNTSRYISREKLGITLGVKAAANEWCLLMNSNCYPTTTSWLEEIGKACHDDKNIVLGYSNYDKKSKAYQRFYRLRHFSYLWRESLKGKTYAANEANLAFRKSEFINNDGFRGNLHIIRGEFDFIVNKLAKKGHTAVVTQKESILLEKAPHKRQWHRRRLFYVHSCKFMERGFRHHVLPFLDTLFLHLSWVTTVAAIVLSAVFAGYIILAASMLSLIILIVGRIIIDNKAIKAFNADISAWKLIPIEIFAIWHSLADRIRYYWADSYDFTCHKV